MTRKWLWVLATVPSAGLWLTHCQSLDIQILPADAGTTSDTGSGAHADVASESASDAAAREDGRAHADAGHHEATDGGADGDALQSEASGDSGIDCDATICDNFDRTVVIPPGDKRWAGVVCDTDAGATIGVDGTLNITYPAQDGGGSCYLESFSSPHLGHPVPSVGSFQLDFDLNYDTVSTSGVIELVDVTVLPPSGDDINDIELIQLLLSGSFAQLFVLYKRDDYDPHELGYLYAPSMWALPGTDCHITLTVDTTVPSGTATSTCLGVEQTLTPASGTTIPSGYAGPATLNLGYLSANSPSSAWSLMYGNLVFRALP
jgi:hypothetical protein